MTSTTLKCKSNFIPAFSKTFKRRLIDMISVLALTVILPILALLVIFNDYVTRSYRGKLDMTEEAVVLLCITAVIGSFFAFFAAPKMFSEIYKKQSCDLYFATPIKREEHFCANFLYGFMIIAAEFLLTGLIFNITVPLMSNKMVQFTIDWPAYIKTAIPVFLAVIALYSIFILCAVTAGRKIHYILLSFISIICSSTLISGFVLNINSIWGLSVNSIIPSALNPIENAICTIINNPKQIILPSVISVIETVAFFIVGLVVFKHRKAEAAEVSLTGKIVPYVFLAILAGAAFMYSSFANGIIITIVSGLVLVTLITMAFSGIFYKKVFTKQTGITALCVFVICTLFTGIVSVPSYSGFVKKLPEASEVESVEIYDLAYNSEFSGFIGTLSNNILLNYDLGTDIKITSEQGIKDTIALHQKIIDDKTIEVAAQNNTISIIENIFGGGYAEDYATYDCRIVYNLKSGRKLTRTYSAPTTFLINEFVALMKNEEAINQTAPFNIKKENILFADFEKYDYNAEEDFFDYSVPVSDFIMNSEECSQFIDVYKNDLLQMEGTKFTDTLNYPFYTYNSYMDTATVDSEINITIYYINEDTPEEIRQEYLNMTPAQTRAKYNNSFDSAFDYEDYVPVTTEYISVNANNNSKTFEYLNSIAK